MKAPGLAALLPWYDASRRDLPWRRTRDPYAVWVSEMMLQQTQVATVLGYYERWMRRFPTIHSLADAAEHDVLHAWQGLGYYSRARNLWRGAKAVVSDHGGKVPATAASLRSLPGIGPYSAGAIASIAFGERAAIVDGNIVRVLCRLFGLRGDPSKSPLKADLWKLAERLVPKERPGDFNQALMELGATVCTPRAPRCDACPMRKGCIAHREGSADALPELPKRSAPVVVARAAAVLERRGRVLCIRVAESASRWAGMWQFPNTDVARGEPGAEAAARSVREATGLPAAAGERLLTVRHSVTHHRITLDVFRCTAPRGTARALGCGEVNWFAPSALDELAMPSAHRRIATSLAAGKEGTGSR
jgi:A/G-specific adenine glycosylase